MNSFISSFERRVNSTIQKYNLASKRDKVFIACSGGKDSTTVLYLLKKFGYNVEALTIDLAIGDWSKRSLASIISFCSQHKIKLHIVKPIKEIGRNICHVRSIAKEHRLSSCLSCGVIKRWLINRKARELGADKLATGHNLDDEAQTIMMNLLKANPKLLLALGPETGFIRDRKFIPRIKPLYFCREADVRKYSKLMDLPVLYDKCPCAGDGLRTRVKLWLNEMEKANPKVKENIAKSFLSVLPSLRKNLPPDDKLNYCSFCGEPSRRDVCKSCKLLQLA